MTKPDWCPSDVWDRANEITPIGEMTYTETVDFIARTILSERDRAINACVARINKFVDYDGSTGDQYDEGYSDATSDSIAAIRSLKETP